jgi:hypothetical protein
MPLYKMCDKIFIFNEVCQQVSRFQESNIYDIFSTCSFPIYSAVHPISPLFILVWPSHMRLSVVSSTLHF